MRAVDLAVLYISVLPTDLDCFANTGYHAT